MDPQSLGLRIRQARERQGLSQEELASSLDLGQRAISELENGKRRLPVTDLPDLARVLDVSILYFFGDEVHLDDLDIALIKVFHSLPNNQVRQTVVEIIRLLTHTYR